MQNLESGTAVKVRLHTYKSVRHYGGRNVTPTAHICSAVFIRSQRDGTELVELTEVCAGYQIGSKIAVQPIDFNI